MHNLNKLPNGWEWRKLGDVTKTTSGGTPSRGNKAFWSGSIPWLKSGELNDGLIIKCEEYISDIALKNSSAKIFPKDTLLIAMYGATAGKLGFLGFDSTTNQAICAILNDKTKIHSRFIYYFLLKERAKIIEDSFGGAQPNISQNYIRNIDIPLPQLEEQKRIVGKLDGLFAKADKAIALLDESIASASALLPSALNEVFEKLRENLEMIAVEKVLSNIQTGTTPSKQMNKYYQEPQAIDWFSPSDFNEEKVLTSSKNKLNQFALDEKKIKYYEENSLLLVAIGATVGKIGIIRHKATSNQQITALKFKNNILIDFAYYWFKHTKETIIGKASTATMPIINQSGIKSLPILSPPLSIQTEVVAHLDAVREKSERLSAKLKTQRAELIALKASLLERAFKGEL